MRTAYLLFFVLLAAALLVDFSSARSRGGSISIRTRSGSGSSRSSGSRAKSYSSYNAAIAASVTVSGMTRYRARHHNSNDYDDNPTVCYTTDSGRFDNGTFTSHLGYFVCPYDSSDADSDTYCCGPSDQQSCGGFWQHGGRMLGAGFGIAVGVILIPVVICCVVVGCEKEKGEKDSSSSPQDNSDNLPPRTEPASYSLNLVRVQPIPKNPDLAPAQYSTSAVKSDTS